MFNHKSKTTLANEQTYESRKTATIEDVKMIVSSTGSTRETVRSTGSTRETVRSILKTRNESLKADLPEKVYGTIDHMTSIVKIPFDKNKHGSEGKLCWVSDTITFVLDASGSTDTFRKGHSYNQGGQQKVPSRFSTITSTADSDGDDDNGGMQVEHVEQIDDVKFAKNFKTKPILAAELDGLACCMVRLISGFDLSGVLVNVCSFSGNFQVMSRMAKDNEDAHKFFYLALFHSACELGSTLLFPALSYIKYYSNEFWKACGYGKGEGEGGSKRTWIIATDGQAQDCELVNDFFDEKEDIVFAVGAGSISDGIGNSNAIFYGGKTIRSTKIVENDSEKINGVEDNGTIDIFSTANFARACEGDDLAAVLIMFEQDSNLSAHSNEENQTIPLIVPASSLWNFGGSATHSNTTQSLSASTTIPKKKTSVHPPFATQQQQQQQTTKAGKAECDDAWLRQLTAKYIGGYSGAYRDYRALIVSFDAFVKLLSALRNESVKTNANVGWRTWKDVAHVVCENSPNPLPRSISDIVFNNTTKFVNGASNKEFVVYKSSYGVYIINEKNQIRLKSFDLAPCNSNNESSSDGQSGGLRFQRCPIYDSSVPEGILAVVRLVPSSTSAARSDPKAGDLFLVDRSTDRNKILNAHFTQDDMRAKFIVAKDSNGSVRAREIVFCDVSI